MPGSRAGRPGVACRRQGVGARPVGRRPGTDGGLGGHSSAHVPSLASRWAGGGLRSQRRRRGRISRGRRLTRPAHACDRVPAACHVPRLPQRDRPANGDGRRDHRRQHGRAHPDLHRPTGQASHVHQHRRPQPSSPCIRPVNPPDGWRNGPNSTAMTYKIKKHSGEYTKTRTTTRWQHHRHRHRCRDLRHPGRRTHHPPRRHQDHGRPEAPITGQVGLDLLRKRDHPRALAIPALRQRCPMGMGHLPERSRHRPLDRVAPAQDPSGESSRSAVSTLGPPAPAVPPVLTFDPWCRRKPRRRLNDRGCLSSGLTAPRPNSVLGPPRGGST